MKTELNIRKSIIASLLLIIWALPTYLHFSHHLEENHYHTHTLSLQKDDHTHTFGNLSYLENENDHIHAVSHKAEDHLHAYELHCEMCDYQFSNFIYEFENYPETILTPIISKITQDTFTSLCYYSLQTNTQLRAPPAFS